MAKEADFYSPEEVSKVIGIPERRVFGMLCGGELEGHQDELARWWVPASALHARRESGYSPKPEDSAGDGVGSRATEGEPRGSDATTVRADHAPLREPPGADAPGSEETTREAGEAPAGKVSVEETTQSLPRGNYRTANLEEAAPDESAARLATAEARELRTRLELAEAAKIKLRKSLKRERRRADQLQEELRAEREKGFWQKLSGG